MTSERTMLPEYAHPPLVAATLGVFAHLAEKMEDLPLKEFQRQLGPEWMGEWEKYPEGKTHLELKRDIGLLPMGFELKNVLGDRMVRISKFHLAFTWLATADGRYPRYENLRDGFVAVWDSWCNLTRQSSDDVLRLSVCYTNLIPQGTVWQTPADWSFFKLLTGPTAVGAGQLKLASWQFRFPNVAWGVVVDWTVEEASTPAIWIRLMADDDSVLESRSILDGMDAGRAAIVQTFSDLMSPAANAYWGLRRREK